MPVFLAPAPVNVQTFFKPGGNEPANGAFLFFYAAGSSSKANVYSTNLGNVAWSNPIQLNSGGSIPNNGAVWFASGQSYKVVLAPSTDSDPPTSPYWTADNLSGVNDIATTSSGEWVLFSGLPTFAGSTSFTVVGDQTSTFTVGRRVKTTNSGGTIYGTVLSSTFVILTTVTILPDSGSLDAGLIAVSYGVLSTPNGSIPWTQVTATGLTATTNAVTNVSLSVSSTLTFSSGVYNAAQTTVASTTSPNIWSGGNVINYTGSATASTFANAPQAGANRTLLVASTSVFNSSAALTISGNTSTYAARAGDRIDVFATSTNAFTIFPYTPIQYGSWTPSVGGSATYLAQDGTYVKIGRLVFIRCVVSINAIGTGSTITISGLPFTAANPGLVTLACDVNASCATNIVSANAVIGNGGSTIGIESRTAAQAGNASNAIFGNLTIVFISGAYIAAS